MEFETTGFDSSDRFETVAEFATLMEFDFARGLLQSAGIECFCPEEHLLAASGGLYSFAVHPRLQVRASDVEKARSILDAPFAVGDDQ